MSRDVAEQRREGVWWLGWSWTWRPESSPGTTVSPFLPCNVSHPASLLPGSFLCFWLATVHCVVQCRRPEELAFLARLTVGWSFLQLKFACQEGSMVPEFL